MSAAPGKARLKKVKALSRVTGTKRYLMIEDTGDDHLTLRLYDIDMKKVSRPIDLLDSASSATIMRLVNAALDPDNLIDATAGDGDPDRAPAALVRALVRVGRRRRGDRRRRARLPVHHPRADLGARLLVPRPRVRALPLFLFALGASACAEPVIELSLQLPSAAQLPEGFDLSCVSTVDVVAIGQDQDDFDDGFFDLTYQCVESREPAPELHRSAAPARRTGQIELPASGLAGIELRGIPGTCADRVRYQEAPFYGGAVYLEGMDQLTIPVVPNISCDRKQTYTVVPIDLLATTQSGQCTPPGGQDPIVFGGNIRPRMLGREFGTMDFDYGASAMEPDQAGKAVIASYAGAVGPSCIAMGFESSTMFAGSCINRGSPTACAAPGELELPVMNGVVAAMSVETELVKTYGEPVFGAVWRASGAGPTPVQGATVELRIPARAWWSTSPPSPGPSPGSTARPRPAPRACSSPTSRASRRP